MARDPRRPPMLQRPSAAETDAQMQLIRQLQDALAEVTVLASEIADVVRKALLLQVEDAGRPGCPHHNLIRDISGGPVQCGDCGKTWLKEDDVS